MDLEHLVSAVAFQAGEEVVLDHLHRDRRRTLLRSFRREVRQGRPHETAHVDAVMTEELLVLHRQECVDDVGWDVGVRDGLRVLQLVEADLLAVDVVDVRALGERLELGKLHGKFLVRVHRRPDARRDTDHGGRDQQGTCCNDQQQPWDEPEETHSGFDDTAGLVPVDGRPRRSPLRSCTFAGDGRLTVSHGRRLVRTGRRRTRGDVGERPWRSADPTWCSGVPAWSPASMPPPVSRWTGRSGRSPRATVIGRHSWRARSVPARARSTMPSQSAEATSPSSPLPR